MSSSCITRSRTFSGLRSTPNFRITRPICPPTLWLGLSVSNGFWNTTGTVTHHLRAALLHRHLAQVLVVEHDLAVGRRLQAEEDLGEGRLAAARSPTIATVSASRASWKSSFSFALTVRTRSPRISAMIELSWIS